MEVNKDRAYAEIATTAAKYIQNAAKKYLPDSAQKEFMVWILENDNRFQDDYLKMLGVASSIKLEIAMLSQIVDDSNTFNKLSPYLGYLNAYFAFETIQDNLAIGLAAWFTNHNPMRELQYEIVKNFNPIMIKKLQGDSTATSKLLAPYITMTKKISAYERCLSPDKMYQFANEFEKQNDNPSLLDELEHCFYPILLLNIETSLDLQHSLKQNQMYPLLQQSLIARYAAVDKLLHEAHSLSSLELADLGAKAILVLPTLVYCIGALDIISPNDYLYKVIKNDLLMQGVYSSALLVRLLNDIGTNLLTLDATKQNKFFNDLKRFSEKNKFTSIVELLAAIDEDSTLGYLMVRLRKDIQYGEFNICFDNISKIDDMPKALNEFCERIVFYSKLYQHYHSMLNEICNKLENTLHDSRISKFIFNMFKFHEKMYSLKFESTHGDYAILGKDG